MEPIFTFNGTLKKAIRRLTELAYFQRYVHYLNPIGNLSNKHAHMQGVQGKTPISAHYWLTIKGIKYIFILKIGRVTDVPQL